MLANAKSIELFVILLVLLVPGVIIDFVRSQFVARRTRSFTEAGIGFIVVSLLYYALAMPFMLVWTSSWRQLIMDPMPWYLLLFVGPISIGLLLGWLAQSDVIGGHARRWGLNVIHPMPTAWDRRFSTLNSSWVIITLKDGRTVAGWMGSKSVASSDSDDRDLFIEKIYELADDTWKDVGGKSALIMSGEISTIEFIQPVEGA